MNKAALVLGLALAFSTPALAIDIENLADEYADAASAAAFEALLTAKGIRDGEREGLSIQCGNVDFFADGLRKIRAQVSEHEIFQYLEEEDPKRLAALKEDLQSIREVLAICKQLGLTEYMAD